MGNSLIHDPTSGVTKEFIKAFGDAHKGNMAYAEQVNLDFDPPYRSAPRGIACDPNTHNDMLLEANQYYDS